MRSDNHESAGRTWRGRAALLATGTFAVGTDAFVVAGILPQVARSLHVPLAQAGQLVTVFALAYAVLSPLLAAATGRWPRRRLLLAALGVFTLGNVATALAPTFALVLATRVLAAAGAGLVTPQASIAAAALAPPATRARAISVATVGLTVATALGAPLGTALAAAVGWRGTIWLVAGLGAAAAGAIFFGLPQVPSPPPAGLRERLAPATDRRVLAALATTLIIFTGVYLVYTYISVVFAGATDGHGGTLALLLFVFGVFATAGNLVAGALADRYGPRAVVAAAAVVLIGVFLLLRPGAGNLPSALILAAVYGLAAFAITVPQQHRLIALRPSQSSLAVALNASFLYLAVTLSGGIGGLVIGSTGAAWIGVIAAGFVLAASACSELAHRLAHPKALKARRRVPGSTGGATIPSGSVKSGHGVTD